MVLEPEPNAYRSEVEGLCVEARPEWVAGHYWWRIYLQGHSKVLLRHRDHAIRVAELMAYDEALVRREQEAG